jgi:flagellar assembly protein FliH
MSRIITNEETQNHKILKYAFKSLLSTEGQSLKEKKESEESFAKTKNENQIAKQVEARSVLANHTDTDVVSTVPDVAPVKTPNPVVEEVSLEEPVVTPFVPQEVPVEQETEPNPANDAFSEELLKKVDELTGSVIKMEMQLEKQQNEANIRLDEERKLAHEQGVEIGRKEQLDLMEEELNSQKQQLIHSITKMDEVANEFAEVSKNIESELVGAAIDIAKEVLMRELGENSNEVALSLAKALLENVKGAMAITIKANPEDAHFLKQEFNEESAVSIESDNAVSAGGVIITSDAGNVNGSVMERFESVKRNLMQ